MSLPPAPPPPLDLAAPVAGRADGAAEPQTPSGEATLAAPRTADLARLVMRRSVRVALAACVLTLGLALLRMQRDIADEVDAAAALAEVVAALTTLPSSEPEDKEVLRRLQSAAATLPLRHLRLEARDEQGRWLLPAAAPPAQPPWWAATTKLHEWAFGTPAARAAQWTVLRPSGARWTVSLHAHGESERLEALAALAETMLLMALACAALLWVMRAQVARAMRPVADLLAAIGRIGTAPPPAGARPPRLPEMPVQELESTAAALRALAQRLDAAESHRRALAQRVLTLQEDERANIARELHDEFGQHLSALRVDLAWLARQPHDAGGSAGAAAASHAQALRGMDEHVQALQALTRALLQRLRPPAAEAGGEQGSLADLASWCAALVAAWNNRAGRVSAEPPSGRAAMLHLLAYDEQGRSVAWPGRDVRLPAPLSHALCRMTQEALTNVARHADAQTVEVTFEWRPAARLVWSVRDDGRGLPDGLAAALRGSGLAGMQERALAFGATLVARETRPGHARPGLALDAVFDLGNEPWAPG